MLVHCFTNTLLWAANETAGGGRQPRRCAGVRTACIYIYMVYIRAVYIACMLLIHRPGILYMSDIQYGPGTGFVH